MKPLSTAERARLQKLIERLTPDERALLSASLDQIAELPTGKRRALAKQIAQFIHQRGTN